MHSLQSIVVGYVDLPGTQRSVAHLTYLYALQGSSYDSTFCLFPGNARLGISFLCDLRNPVDIVDQTPLVLMVKESLESN